MLTRALRTLVVLFVTFATLTQVRAEASAWRKLREDDGIASFRRELAGQPLPAFRARAVFEHDLWLLLAILEDVDRAAEWTAHCAEMREVRRLSSRELLVYARMDAPWPVQDRDVMVRVTVQEASASQVTVSIRSTSEWLEPVPADVVRMPLMRASYRFHLRDHGRTEVDYELEVDPGGALPDWLKAMVARNLAHDTLARLRARASWAKQRSLYGVRAQELELAPVRPADRS